jgi:hypothetical protein
VPLRYSDSRPRLRSHEPAGLDRLHFMGRWTRVGLRWSGFFIFRHTKTIIMRRFLLWPVTIFWLVLCLGLSTIVILEYLHAPSIIVTSSAVTTVRLEPKFELESLGFHPQSRHLIRTITDRPVFSSSRRPYVSSPADEDPDEIDIKLVCVLTTKSARTALVELETGEKLIRIHEHDFVSDWQVESISADHLYLRRNGNVRIVNLWPVFSG